MKKANLSVKNHINAYEKSIGLLYVFLMFATIMGFCTFLLINQNKDLDVLAKKVITIKKMKRIKDYQNVQRDVALTCDSIYARINNYNPRVQASYEESDIEFLINEVRNIYNQNSWDKRNKIFEHIANFYDGWLIDKKELWSKQQNILYFKANLEECEAGIERKNERLNANQK